MSKRTFEEWMANVNQEMDYLAGLDSQDLPDADYWEAWDEGKSPSFFARHVLQANGLVKFSSRTGFPLSLILR